MSDCELLIQGGQVIDGTGAAQIRADVAVSDGRIVAIGDLSGWSADERIDASGLAVAPGFIDAHTHDDRMLLDEPGLAPKVSQGVTTVVVGNCGIGLPPLTPAGDPPPPLNLLGGREAFRFSTYASYAKALDASPAAVNAVVLAGHSSLRAAVMGDLDRPATEGEIMAMGSLLGEAMEAGCAGLSAGLAYPTAIAAPAGELTALCRRLKPAGGLFSVHIRDEAHGVVEAVREALDIARDADVPVVLSHHKCCARENWGKTRDTLAMVEAARKAGPVDLDVYPYIAGSTVLLEEFVGHSVRTLISWSDPHPEMAGRDLAEVAAEWGVPVSEAIKRLLPGGGIYFHMDEDDLRRVLTHSRVMIGSDGLPHDKRPHPRLWGTFVRVLGHYARDEGLFSMEEAVYRMTGLTAGVYGLKDRGRIGEGAAADLVLFDPGTVADRSTYENPTELAAGIEAVLVNGRVVWQDGAPTGARPGRLLRRRSEATAA